MDTLTPNTNIVTGPGGSALTPSPWNYSTLSSNSGNDAINNLDSNINSYTVQPGDYLSQIASQFGTTWQQIYSANQGLIGNNPNLIQPGMQLQIPGSQTPGNIGPGTPGSISTPPTATPAAPTPSQAQGPQQQLPGVPQYQPSPEGQSYLNSLDRYQGQLLGLSSMIDTNYNNELAQINAQMGNLKAQQTKENERFQSGLRQAGIVAGMSETTPEIMSGKLHEAVSGGLQKLTNLTIEQNGLILAAKKANVKDKLDIYKQLKDIDGEKFDVARQMKEDFFTNLERQDALEKRTVSDYLPSLYTELQNLSPEERTSRLNSYAQQLGIPASKLSSFYTEYDKQEQKPIRDMRTALMAEAGDIGWSMSDLTLSPSEFAKKLGSSQFFKNKLLVSRLNADSLQADINYKNAQSAALKASQGSELTPKQLPIFTKLTDKWNKSPLIAANDKTVPLKTISAQLQKDPKNAALQYAFVYSFVKALDTYESAVRNEEVTMISGAQGLGEKINNLPAKIAGGSVLSKSAVKRYLDVANRMTSAINSAAIDKTSVFSAEADITGIGSAWRRFLEESGSSLYKPDLNGFWDN